jgi:hypothetical protein
MYPLHACHKSNLDICYLENLIILFSTLLVGGGQGSPPSSLTQPKKGGSGLLSKLPSRSQSSTTKAHMSIISRFPLGYVGSPSWLYIGFFAIEFSICVKKNEKRRSLVLILIFLIY